MPELPYLDTRLSCSWDASLLAPMAELNGEILESTFGAASGAGEAAGLQWRWRALGEPARLRLASCPYLLLDAGFAAVDRWVRVARSGVQEAAAVPATVAGRATFAVPLIRRVLLFAWHLARCNGPGARISLGMGAECVAAIARCRLVELETLAEQRTGWIRLRWASQPGLWQSWLDRAALESPRALERLQLWGLQSLAADVLAHRSPVRYPVESCADWP
jgi:hypothetical protein